jgi:hypothetical protein
MTTSYIDTSSFNDSVEVFSQSWAKDFERYRNSFQIPARVEDPPGIPVRPDMDFPIPHADQFAAKYNYPSRTYRSYFDEALRDDYQNALAMHRDGFWYELISHRTLPVTLLDHTIKSDDSEDEEQKQVCNQVDLIIRSTNRFQYFKRILLEACFFGKYGVQCIFGKKIINGKEQTVILRHQPVMGDKIIYDWDGTPAVLINPAAPFIKNLSLEIHNKFVRQTDRGMAFFLATPFFRDRFVIHEFEPSDTDFLYEADMAEAVHGLGLRSRMYWIWNLRHELLSWAMDGLQRVGVNGMLVGYYASGNPQAQDNMVNALINLMKNNVTVIATTAGIPPKEQITHIPITGIGYDVILTFVLHFEEIMRRGTLGQNLSSKSAATGLGSGVAELQGDAQENVTLYEAGNFQDTLNDQLIPITLKYNKFKYKGKMVRGDELPFSVFFKFSMDRRNALEAIEVAERLFQMGVPLDGDNLRDKGGLPRPNSKESTIRYFPTETQAQKRGNEPVNKNHATKLNTAQKKPIRYRLNQIIDRYSNGFVSDSSRHEAIEQSVVSIEKALGMKIPDA